jgi:FMN phosphatase YigB (HAD superfamily)
MKARCVRLVVFDVYQTLLWPREGPDRVDEAWEELCAGAGVVGMGFREFGDACAEEVRCRNAASRQVGEPWPEVRWRDVAVAVLPGLARLSEECCEEFLHGHARLQRTCVLYPGVRGVLARLRHSGLLLGMASNGQEYTRRELASAGLPLGWLADDLQFLSGDHGYAKPSPRVFGSLGEAAARRGIRPGEILMVGDREDNDIVPAREAGWQAWHLRDGQRDWPELAKALLGSA